MADPACGGSDFRLDTHNECLLRGSVEYPLRPKTYAVLQRLVSHPGRLVTKSQLLDSVWTDSYVSDMVLKVSIRELRKAFDDDARDPRYIQTLYGRGYRFIGRLDVAEPLPGGCSGPPTSLFCGRQKELDKLSGCLAKALSGERQVIFVSGRAGIGKTALVEAFLARTSARNPTIPIARGQCQELHGRVEACLPFLEGLERLCRETGRERLAALLGRYAPSWLAQMPSLIDEVAYKTWRHRVGSDREPILRELIVALEPLTAEAPLVQVVEDLQWSDRATLDLLLALGQRRQPARWLLIATCRQPLAAKHELLEEVHRQLVLHKQCVDLPLAGLDASEVAAWLASTLPDARGGAELAEKLWRWTRGHPLYLESLVEELLERGYLTCRHGLWHLDARAEKVVPRGLDPLVAEGP